MIEVMMMIVVCILSGVVVRDVRIGCDESGGSNVVIGVNIGTTPIV